MASKKRSKKDKSAKKTTRRGQAPPPEGRQPLPAKADIRDADAKPQAPDREPTAREPADQKGSSRTPRPSQAGRTDEPKWWRLTPRQAAAVLTTVLTIVLAVLSLLFGANLWERVRWRLFDIEPVKFVFENRSGAPIEVKSEGTFRVLDGQSEVPGLGHWYLCGSDGEPIGDKFLPIARHDPNAPLELRIRLRKTRRCFDLYCEGDHLLTLDLELKREERTSTVGKGNIPFNKQDLKKRQSPFYYRGSEVGDKWKSPAIGIGFTTRKNEADPRYLSDATDQFLLDLGAVRNSGQRFFVDCACQSIQEWRELHELGSPLPLIFVEVMVGCYELSGSDQWQVRTKLRHARYPDAEEEIDLKPSTWGGQAGVVSLLLEEIRDMVLEEYPPCGTITEARGERTFDLNVGTDEGVQPNDKFRVGSHYHDDKYFGTVKVVEAYEDHCLANIEGQPTEGIGEGCMVRLVTEKKGAQADTP